jgi:hypothetical protein
MGHLQHGEASCHLEDRSGSFTQIRFVMMVSRPGQFLLLLLAQFHLAGLRHIFTS